MFLGGLKMMLFIIITLSLALFNFAKCELKTCYQLEENPFSYFATKTAYSYVSANQNNKEPSCKTLQLWMLSRHGTRHPASDMIKEMYELYEYRNNLTDKSSLCQKDIDAIKAWSFNLTSDDGNKLNSQGAIDLTSLGLRLKNDFEDIFNEPYNPTTFRVISSPISRAVDSASYFLKSAFNMSSVDIPIMKSDDMRLNISILKEVQDTSYSYRPPLSEEKEITLEEDQTFVNSVHVKQLLSRVSKTLGLDRNLTFKTVRLMYESCRYEKAWHNNSHPAWCAVFSKEDLEVLEFKEDLYHYYSNGYGNPHNERPGCPLLKDLITNFRNKATTQLGPKGIFYFGHASNMLSTIVRLGFARDPYPLLNSNFKEMSNRKWKTSKLIPFAANIMAVLYECPSGKKVQFFVNEIPMVVEKYGCTLCPWESIESMFDPIVSSPSCTADKTSSASTLSKTMVVFSLTCLLSLFNAFNY